jgi:GNAT superfamily N-acetyltransferase
MTALRYLMRDAGEDDRNFVVRSWVKEMRHSPWTRHVPNGVYLPAQHQLVHQILGGSQAIVAADREKPELLFGCVVHAGPVVHWLYVKGAYRGLGIGRALLFSCFGDVMPSEIVCTQASQLFEERALLERYNVIYSPYLLMGIGLPHGIDVPTNHTEPLHG